MSDSVFDIPLTTIDGRSVTLKDYPAKAYLIVNTASACGFTPQYQGLESLWSRFGDCGLQVLGFPCNQFGGQEPCDERVIRQFCELNYGVTFPLFQKTEVNGRNAHPLFVYLKRSAPGVLGTKAIKWNFTKFLLNSGGEVVRRYGSAAKPADIASDIEALIA